MDWKLLDENGNVLQDVNCQYDACDISQWDYNVESLKIDFNSKTATIIKRNGELNEQ